MDIRLFIDFGSTFTKIIAFDLDREEIAAAASAVSTADTDVTVGLREALGRLRESVALTDADIRGAEACSSAAGGLRMVCVGLVPEYTTEAGRLAALGAGAKVVATYSYELSRAEAAEIERLAPDIVLLTGGTDGGDRRVICHNARMLSEIAHGNINIIVAGNKSAGDEIRDIFSADAPNRTGREIIKAQATETAGFQPATGGCFSELEARDPIVSSANSPSVIFAKNVMPEFGKLDIDPVNEKIRDLFIHRITEAKGISKAKEIISGVIMPTPSAVLLAAVLLADGTEHERGLGELLLVDVGGATTDVHSVARGAPPASSGAHLVGLPEPYAKRTVEGDIGLYHNFDTLVELAIKEGLLHPQHPLHPPHPAGEREKTATLPHKLYALRDNRSVPSGDEQTSDQLILSRLAVKTAVDRHAGRIERRMTHNGELWLQHGKDLSNVKHVIGAGGPLAFSQNARFVLEGATQGSEPSPILKPRAPSFLVDKRYILYAAGLLSQTRPDSALRIMKKYLATIQ